MVKLLDGLGENDPLEVSSLKCYPFINSSSQRTLANRPATAYEEAQGSFMPCKGERRKQHDVRESQASPGTFCVFSLEEVVLTLVMPYKQPFSLYKRRAIT